MDFGVVGEALVLVISFRPAVPLYSPELLPRFFFFPHLPCSIYSLSVVGSGQTSYVLIWGFPAFFDMIALLIVLNNTTLFAAIR